MYQSPPAIKNLVGFGVTWIPWYGEVIKDGACFVRPTFLFVVSAELRGIVRRTENGKKRSGRRTKRKGRHWRREESWNRTR